LPNIQYLSCTIIYRGVIPQAVFALNSGVIPINLRPIIENHFSALKLFERYKLRSNSEIVDVFNSISPYAGILSRLQIQTQLQGEAANMRRSKGDNYWRAVIRIALANSNAFLTSAGY
jgi:hypothetical protein